MASGGGTSSTLAALVKAKAQIAKTSVALGLSPRPVTGPMRPMMPTNNAVSLKPRSWTRTCWRLHVSSLGDCPNGSI